MIEFADATEFIKNFETIYSKHIIRIPYTTKDGLRKTILMALCCKRYISLPYMSLGVIENKITDRKKAPFMLFETEEGNIISTSKKTWEIRDTSAHSHNIYSDKLFIWQDLTKKDSIMELYTSDIRRKVRKAIKNGIIVKHCNTKASLNDFYKVYTRRMHEIRTASQSKKTIYKAVQLGVTDIFVAYKQENANKLTIVGAATLSKIKPDIYLNALFCTLSVYNKYYVSYLLHYNMMSYAKDKQAIYYSFGRSTRGSSVHNYKKHYKAEEIPLYWSYSKKITNIRKKQWLYKIWAHLPFWITKQIGPIIHKYVY